MYNNIVYNGFSFQNIHYITMFKMVAQHISDRIVFIDYILIA